MEENNKTNWWNKKISDRESDKKLFRWLSRIGIAIIVFLYIYLMIALKW